MIYKVFKLNYLFLGIIALTLGLIVYPVFGNHLLGPVNALTSSNTSSTAKLTISLKASNGTEIFVLRDLPLPVCGDDFSWTVGDPCTDWKK